MSVDKPKDFPAHDEQIANLRRIEGQVRGVIDMIGDRRYCLEILTLCKGIRSALAGVEENILMKYIDTCFTEAVCSQNKKSRTEKIEEIRLLLKKSR